MATKTESNTNNSKKILVQEDGPYTVQGDIPLVRKTQVVSEYGEPIAWKKGETFETGETYKLCRCGQSSNKPFCDKTHVQNGFDGTESADTNSTAERRVVYAGGTRIVVKRDYSLCMEAGFCGNRFTNIQKMVKDTADTRV